MSKMSFCTLCPPPQAHVIDGKMIIKVQHQNRKKYIKLQTPDFEEFISEGKCSGWHMTNQ